MKEFENKNLKYWHVHMKSDSPQKDVCLYAERYGISSQGDLVFSDGELIIHAIAAGQWAQVIQLDPATEEKIYVEKYI